MPEQSLLTRTLKVGLYGKDVQGAKRTVYRGLDMMDGGHRLKKHNAQALKVKRTFGAFFRTDVNRLNKEFGLKQDGRFDADLLHYAGVRGYPDALAYSLFNQYRDELPPPKPVLVEPNQGFDSLVADMWEAYTIGRNMGLSDLGTYNPGSTLPSSGRASDHATSRLDGRISQPACAYDLGIDPDTGWNNLKARAYVQRIVGRKEIEYVILGDRIWTRRGFGSYHSGGHLNHVHTSGHRR